MQDGVGVHALEAMSRMCVVLKPRSLSGMRAHSSRVLNCVPPVRFHFDHPGPAFSAIQATFWDALCLSNVFEAEPGFGSLFDCFPAS